MDLLINVFLLMFGFVGAAVAIGGKTWLETPSELYKGITKRGWIAITCLVLTLILGIWKEIRTESIRTELADSRARLDESRRLLKMTVQAVQPSQQFRELLISRIQELTKAKGFPKPHVTVFENVTLFDFLNDSGQRVGYVVLQRRDMADMSLLQESDLNEGINDFLFGHWGNDNIDRDWDTIRDRLERLAHSILMDRFNAHGIHSGFDGKDAIFFYPIDDRSNQLSKNRLQVSRDDLGNLIKMPPIARGARIADLAGNLQ